MNRGKGEEKEHQHGNAVIRVRTAVERERERKQREERRQLLASLKGKKWEDLNPQQRDALQRYALETQGILDADGVVIIDIEEV